MKIELIGGPLDGTAEEVPNDCRSYEKQVAGTIHRWDKEVPVAVSRGLKLLVFNYVGVVKQGAKR